MNAYRTDRDSQSQGRLAQAVRDRARGVLLGLAVGDALGAPVEFMTPGEIRAEHGVLQEMKGGGWLKIAPGRVTDDTEMSLCVARALVTSGFSLRAISERFATWLRSRPLDVGNTCRRGIRRFIHDGSLSGPRNEGDAGNGAVMRVAPIALATLGDVDLLEQWAIGQAHITHHHALSDAACVLVGRLVQTACLGATIDQLRAEADAAIARTPSFRFVPYRGLATTYVVDTIQTVLHHFFTTTSFEECIVATVCQGGDADTTASIAGAIAGAFYGPDAIPTRWLRRMDQPLLRELDRLADRLVDECPGERCLVATPAACA